MEGLSFGNLEAMRKVLTPKWLGLLRVIRRDRPASVYALAKTTGRDLRNVQDDVPPGDLSELSETGGRRMKL